MANRKPITRSELQIYRARWNTIEKFLLKKAKAKTMDERLALMNELYCWARDLDMLYLDNDEAELEQVRQRWVKLKELYEQKNSRME